MMDEDYSKRCLPPPPLSASLLHLLSPPSFEEAFPFPPPLGGTYMATVDFDTSVAMAENYERRGSGCATVELARSVPKPL